MNNELNIQQTSVADCLSQYGYYAEPISIDVVRKLFHYVMNPCYVSPDMSELYDATFERNGLSVSIPFTTIDDIQSHACKLVDCLSMVLSTHKEAICYIMVSLYQDNNKREDILRCAYYNLIVKLEQLYNPNRLFRDLQNTRKDEGAMISILITFPDSENPIDWDTILTEHRKLRDAQGFAFDE